MRNHTRLDDVDVSWIVKFFDEVKNPHNVINLGVGEPDFDIFEPLKEEAMRVIRKGLNKYTQTAGIPELREAIAESYSRSWGADVSPDNVFVTPGASNALFMSLASIITRPRDEVAIPTPSFPPFKGLSLILGGKPVEIGPERPDSFQPSLESIREAIGDKTAAIIVNSPTNPTGVVYSEEILAEIVEACRQYGVYIIADEVYERFVYSKGYTSLARFWKKYDKIVIVNSFSKTLAMTGWRLGYMIVPEQLRLRVLKLQAFINACAPSIAQHVALYALRSPEIQRMINEKVLEYEKRRDIMCEALESRGVLCHKPEGGIYLFPRITATLDSETFCTRLAREEGVVTIPGKAFGKGGEGHFRVTLSAQPERLVEAAVRIASFIGRVSR